MEITIAALSGLSGGWRITGTDQSFKLSVRPGGKVLVEVDEKSYQVSMAVALALSSPEAKAFLASEASQVLLNVPRVVALCLSTQDARSFLESGAGEFLYSAVREPRVKAALGFAHKETNRLQASYAREIVQAGLATEAEAIELAKLRYPKTKPLNTREPALVFCDKTGVARLKSPPLKARTDLTWI